MNVELHIEELVLHGFPPDYRHRIGNAVEHELSRLFTEQGLPLSLSRGVDIPRLDAGAFEMNTDLGANAVGAHVARALYGGMS